MKAIRTTYKLADSRELIIKTDGESVVVFVGHHSDGLTRTDPMTRYELRRGEFALWGSSPLSRETRKTIARIADQAYSRGALHTKGGLETILTAAIAQHAI
jgi:hypothetical protein